MYWCPQLLYRSFQKARNFTASSHQNAGFSIWVLKNFLGVIPPKPSQREGRPLPAPSPTFGDQTLVPLNFLAVVVPLVCYIQMGMSPLICPYSVIAAWYVWCKISTLYRFPLRVICSGINEFAELLLAQVVAFYNLTSLLSVVWPADAASTVS